MNTRRTSTKPSTVVSMDRANPAEDSALGSTVNQTVWYLSHPIAPDEHMSLEDNIADTKELVALFWRAGVRVIAPYLTVIEALGDAPEFRVPGLEADMFLCKRMGPILLTGHKISKGMEHEYESAQKSKFFRFYDFTGVSNENIVDYVQRNLDAFL